MQYTIPGALALAGLAALAAVGASWFIHLRRMRAQARELQAQFTAMLQDAARQADAKLEQARAEFHEALQQRVRDHAVWVDRQLLEIRREMFHQRADDQRQLHAQLASLGGDLRERLAAIEARAGEERLALRADFASHRAEMQQQLQAQGSAIRTDFSRTQRDAATLWDAYYGHEKAYARHRAEDVQKFSDLSRRIQAVDLVARQAEESVWDVRGVPVNVLRSQFLALQAAIDAGARPRVELVLARILRTLDSLGATGQRADAWTLDRVRKTTELAAALAPAAATEVLDRLEAG